MSNKCFRPSVK